MSEGKKIISHEELAKHTSSDDLWMAIYGKVYDITSFLDDHPGGDEVLKDTAGRDATVEFDDVGHSDEAVDMMEQYYVGELEGGAKKETNTRAAPQADNFAVRPSQQSKWQRLFIPIVVIVLTLVIRYVIVNGILF
mmetsp:Transcript_10039/g.12350  ORF Transcript_10039/g.12350 Transcript_10039/m.12350 type:complete len:136 (-) Transcript_10039:47-454(-)